MRRHSAADWASSPAVWVGCCWSIRHLAVPVLCLNQALFQRQAIRTDQGKKEINAESKEDGGKKRATGSQSRACQAGTKAKSV
jgi:hypothetical protein